MIMSRRKQSNPKPLLQKSKYTYGLPYNLSSVTVEQNPEGVRGVRHKSFGINTFGIINSFKIETVIINFSITFLRKSYSLLQLYKYSFSLELYDSLAIYILKEYIPSGYMGSHLEYCYCCSFWLLRN